jgi:isopentenyl-diphosphate delta-isomerase
MNEYYKKKQIIAKVDENGKVIGEIEKWEAHKKGILHKALTITLIYKGQFVIQKRKHPAFDGVYDITSSSHQLIIDGKLQPTEEASYDCLKREWRLEANQVGKLDNLGSIYYKARDPKSEFTEHEMCEILIAEVNIEPKPNLDFAYESLLVNKQELQNTNSNIYKNLAPWVKKMIEENKL